MVINKQLFYLTILVAVILSACQEKEPLTGNPVVITGSTLTSEKNVVNFTGSLLSAGDASPIDYGFVWSSKKSSPSISDYKFRFKKKPSKGSFEAEVDYDLLDDSVSYVRAFVETREAVIYGEVREFHAKSSLSPRIISISPKETNGNDTITIFGEHLTSNVSDVSIQYTFERFAGNWPNAKIVYADGKTIRFILSNTPLTTSNDIYLSIKIRNKDIFPDSKINPPLYANVGPQIVGFYPQKVAKNGIVKIKVKNMVGTPDHFTLYSKEYASYQEIESVDGDSIKIKLDDYVRYGNHRIMLVTVNKGITYTCYSKDSLEVKRPEITGIEGNSPSAGDSVTINGRYFTPKFAFYVTNEACPYQHYSEFRFINSNKIRLALSDAIFDGSNQMCINTYDGLVSKFPVQIRSRWTVKSKFPESHRYATCVQSGGRLVFGNWVSNFSSSKDIYIYNIASNSIDKISQPSDMAVYQFVIAKDDDIYMFRKYYANLSEPVPDSYRFNLKTQEWKKLESVKMLSGYSFIDQYSTCLFGGKFYFKQNTNTEVYSYDLAKNAWSYQNSIPIADVNMSFMVEKSAALHFYYVRYYYSGMDRSMVSSYKYNEAQNLWDPEADFGNVPGQISSVFVDGNYFWFGSSGRLYKYSSDGKLVSSIAASYPVSQFYNNKFYGVVTYSDSFNCIVEFDPNKY